MTQTNTQSTNTQSTNEKTLALIQDIKKKKAEIKKLERPRWKTNCTFPYNRDGLKDNVNLHTVNDVKTLIEIVAFLDVREKSYAEAANKLKLNEIPEFTWSGFSVKAWTSDIQTRIDKILIKFKQEKLEKLEVRLNAIVSPELRAELELEAILEELAE